MMEAFATGNCVHKSQLSSAKDSFGHPQNLVDRFRQTGVVFRQSPQITKDVSEGKRLVRVRGTITLPATGPENQEIASRRIT